MLVKSSIWPVAAEVVGTGSTGFVCVILQTSGRPGMGIRDHIEIITIITEVQPDIAKLNRNSVKFHDQANQQLK